MRFSMNIIFIVQWMAGRLVTSGARYYPKPSVSMSSREVVTLGGEIAIRCKTTGQQHAEFSLHKQEGSSLRCLDIEEAKQNEVTFTISNASRSNAGIYRCIYCSKISTHYDQCSDYSDEVRVNIRDPGLTQPFIKVRTSGPLAPGLNVTIECRGPRSGLNFSLYKSEVLRASQVTQPDRDRVEFPLVIKTMEEAAGYTCQYSRKEAPFIWSPPSEPVQLVARGTDSGLTVTLVWAGCGAGLLLVLLLLLAFVLYRKRRKGPTVRERDQLANKSLESFINTDHDGPTYSSHHDGVTYAILNQQSLKTEQATVPDRVPEPCIYASVVKSKVWENQ